MKAGEGCANNAEMPEEKVVRIVLYRSYLHAYLNPLHGIGKKLRAGFQS